MVIRSKVLLAWITIIPATVGARLAVAAPAPSEAWVTAAGHPAEGKIDVFLGKPELDFVQVFDSERFPNVVVATDGTILATWGRTSLRVRRSEDGGATWPLKRLVFEGAFAYSSLHAGRPDTKSEGRIYLFFEGGPQGGATMACFNLSWLLQGGKTGNGTLPKWLEKDG